MSRLSKKDILKTFLKDVDIIVKVWYYIEAVRNAGVAQLVEQLICNQQVFGSSPNIGSFFGRFPEWPKGADCKSVASCFGGSNPPSPTKNQEYRSWYS